MGNWDNCHRDPQIGRPAGDHPVLKVLPRTDGKWCVHDRRKPLGQASVYVTGGIVEAAQHMHFLADEEGLAR